MSFKEFQVEPNLVIKVIKRQKARRIKITLDSSGEIKVSIPYFIPYQTGLAFAKSKLDWIKAKRVTPIKVEDSKQIGKSHRLRFINTDSDRVTTKIVDLTIKIFVPKNLDISDSKIQKAAILASRKALTKEALNLIPQRVRLLAEKHEIDFNNIAVKFTKSRWGSCDNKKNLTFNPNLMNLPWHLIDYVIIHELAHTRKMHHQPDFWSEVEAMLPNYKILRKELKAIRNSF